MPLRFAPDLVDAARPPRARISRAAYVTCVLSLTAVRKGPRRAIETLLARRVHGWCGDLRMHVERTRTSAEGRAAARRAAAAGAAAVLAVGGDGTLRSVASGILDTGLDVPMWFVPMGRGNDFARSLGVPTGLRGLRRLFEGRREVPLDVGCVDVGARRAFFLNGLGIGFEGAVAHRASRLSSLRSVVYLTSAICEILTRPMRYRIQGDVDGEAWTAETCSISVSNGAYVGGGMQTSPAARPDDGRLDLALARAGSAWSLLGSLVHLATGRSTEGDFVRRRFRRARLLLDPPAPLHVDGDPIDPAASALEVQVLPAALRIGVPR